MATTSASPVNRTFTLSPALLGLVGVALLAFLAGCSSSSSTEVPNQADAKIVEVAIREDASQYVWNDADISGQVDVVDKFGKVTTLAAGRRLVLSDGATVRLAGSGLQGVTEAQVWLFSTPRLLNKIPVSTDGSFSSQIIVPSDLEPGQHTVLISATLADGRVVAVNIPAFVPTANTPLDSSSTTENSNPPTTVTLAPTTTTPPTSTSLKKPISTSTTAPRPLPSTAKQTTTTIARPRTTTTTIARPRTTTTTIANNRVSPATTAAPTTVPQSSVATTVPLTTSTTTATTVEPTTTTTTTTVVPVTASSTTTTSSSTTTTTSTSVEPTTTTTSSTTTTTTSSSTTTTTSSTTTTTVEPTTTTTSTTSTTTTTLPASVPSAPSMTSLSATSTAVALTWSVPADNGAAISDYVIQYRRSDGAGWTTLSDGVSDTSSASVTGLNSATGYLFQVAATNSVGTGAYSSLTSACTQTCTRDAEYTTNAGSGANAVISAMAVQSDGDILYGGNFTTWNGATANRVVRLNSNGTTDTDFLTNLGIGANNSTYDFAVQSDGKIVVGGSFTSWNGVTTNRVVRLNADGTKDPTFATNIGTAANGTVAEVEYQSDGKIVLGGSFTSWNLVTVNRIVRLNSDGTRDTAFTTATGTAVATGSVSGLLLQSDGKILVSGNFATWKGSTVGGIVRLNSDGAPDTAFTTKNGTGIDTGGTNAIRSLAIDANGKILIGGQFNLWNSVAAKNFTRLNADGSLDTAFNTNVGTGPEGPINEIVVQSSGKVVVAGMFSLWNLSSVGFRARLTDTGTLDTTLLTIGVNNIFASIWVAKIDGSGKIIFGGDMTHYGSGSVSGVPIGYHFRSN